MKVWYPSFLFSLFCGQPIRVEHAKARLVATRNIPTRDDEHRGDRRRSRSRSRSRERSKKRYVCYFLLHGEDLIKSLDPLVIDIAVAAAVIQVDRVLPNVNAGM